MSILIKGGMEMPKSCYLCHFLFHPERHGKVYCTAVEPMMDISKTISDERANDCPLVEIPPHGDLIDRDALSKDLDRLCDRVCQYSQAQRRVMCSACPLGDAFAVVEDDAPAIIEAEEDE